MTDISYMYLTETGDTGMTIETAARKLAQLMKDAGDDDAGNFGHYFDADISDADWDAVCDRAERLLPLIKVNPVERAAFRRADREVVAEISHERRQLGCGA